MQRLVQIGALAVPLLLAARVQAGNEDEFFLGNRAAMTGGAVTASVDDGSSTFYNPAGLASAQRSSIDVSASAYSVRFYRAPRFLNIDNGPSKDASVTEFIAIPTEIAYLRRLAEGVALGLGYFVPRSSDFVLRENLEARVGDAESNFGLNLRQSRTDYLFSAALGVRVSPWLRLGFGGSASLENEVDAAALFGSVTRSALDKQALQSDEFGTTWTIGTELSAGLQLDVTPELTLGLSVRSPRLRVWQSVSGRSSTLLASQRPNVDASVSSDSRDIHAEGDTLAFVRAGRYIAGIALTLGDGRLNVDVDAQPGLSDLGAGIDRRFTWNARVGYIHELSAHVAVGAGVFTDRATEREGFGPVGARGDFYGGSLGLELNNLHHLAPGESADSLQLSTVFAFRYATSRAATTSLRAHPDAQVPLLLLQETNGDISVHEIGLHVGSALYF